MSNAMRFGKRSLAGLASGALLLSGIAIVAAQPAQAAQTTAVWCSNSNAGGNAGTGTLDPTTVKPNCVLAAGVATVATFGTSAYNAGTAKVYVFTNSGTGLFVETTASADITISTDGKTAIWNNATALAASSAFTNLGLTVTSPGVNTVSITGGPSTLVQDQVDLGTLTVTGTGTSAQAIVSQGYYSVFAAAGTGAKAPLAIVHVVDAQGNVLDLSSATVTNLTSNAASGTVAVSSSTLYTSGDCTATGGLKGSGTATDPGALNSSLIVTDACATTVGAGVATRSNSGLWVTWTGLANPATAGAYTATFTLTVGANTYPITVNYVVSSTVAGAWTFALDADSYAPGGLATATITARDLGGRIVPDGLGWASLTTSGRSIAVETNAPIYSPTTGSAIAPGSLFDDSVATYNGSVSASFLAPPTPMASFVMVVKTLASEGWAAAVTADVKSDSARIGDPKPVEPTIMIVGERGKGDNLNMVFVEGTTTELAGKTVTPYFRFPGETGFTAGTGLRTVDAQGNFAWQRKTGKQIAVQFRAGDVRSNTTIIAAK